MKSVSCWIVVLFMASTPARAAEVSLHARKAVEAIQQLRAIPIDHSGRDSGPPGKVPGLLRNLNAELKALIVENLSDARRRQLLTETELLDQLRAAGWEEIPSHKWDAYGEIHRIRFDWKTDYDPALLVVSTELWLPCGSADPDSAIYVFRESGRKWNLVLATESDFNPTSDESDSGMQYRISPPDDSGEWFLVVGHVPPSCNPDQTVLRYKVLRPGPNPDQPALVTSGREVVDPWYDPAFQIRAESDWFSVTEGKRRKLDREAGVAIIRYAVNRNEARRIHPLALSPEDFLDQWAQLAWDEAKQWARDPAQLQTWHAKLAGLDSGSAEIESAERCSDSRDGDQTWLVELSIDEQPNPQLGVKSLFVDVAKRNGVFWIDGVHPSHPPGCQGRTRLLPGKVTTLPVW